MKNSGVLVFLLLVVLALIFSTNILYISRHLEKNERLSTKDVFVNNKLTNANARSLLRIQVPTLAENRTVVLSPSAVVVQSNSTYAGNTASIVSSGSYSGETKPVAQLMAVSNPIMFGVFLVFPSRTPVVFLRNKLDAQVLRRLQSSPLFSTKTPKELESFGLNSAVDYPKSPGHIYYEGYFHAVNVAEPIESRNPRSGKDFLKRPAGDFIRALYEGFRRINEPLLSELEISLRQNALIRQTNITNDVCGILSEFIRNGRVFGDLSIQIHFGSAIPKEQLFWHADAENSILHLGITVGGTRTIYLKRAKTFDGSVVDTQEVLSSGDVYLSPSAAINHAPQYPETTWDTRIMAIQSRILYSTAELKHFRAVRTDESWYNLVSILSSVFASNSLQTPSEELIDSILAE